jgi:hypothetical protein
MKKIIVTALTVFSLIVVPAFGLVLNANAQSNAANLFGGNGLEENIQGSTGLGNADPREMAARVINIILGFLGIIAVVIILLAGFKWMTAAGNEDKVSEAKKLMGAGVIGLIIILMAFGIAQFVINALYTATGSAV